MKKFICFLLCVILAAFPSTTVYAAHVDGPVVRENIVYRNTEFESIMKSSDNQYLMLYNDGMDSVPVGRLDIDISDEQAMNRLESSKLSHETIDYILGLQDKIGENESVVATVFSPDLLTPTRTAYYYYTYNGMKMKSEKVYLYNISTGFSNCLSESGEAAKEIAETITSVLITVVGYFSTPVALGGTLLSIFEDITGGSVRYATAEDFTQMELIYDDIKQFTYGERYDGWYLGCITEQVYIQQVTEYQQFVVNGVGTQEYTYQYPDTYVKSPDFDSPWATAYANLYNPVPQYIKYTVDNESWYF